jgi:hypothetical protein
MTRPTVRTLIPSASLTLLLCVGGVVEAQVGSAEDRCHQEILRGMAGIKKGRDGQRSRCLKFGNYDDCVETDSHTRVHENVMRNRVAGPSSPCVAAFDAGFDITDFGPASCPPEGNDCDLVVPSILDASDLAECLVCIEQGYDRRIRDALGWPRPLPGDPDERRCTRALAQFSAAAVKKAIRETAACARGGTKPFSCPVDVSDENRFGQALSTLAKKALQCGLEQGKAPGALANLCEGAAVDAAGLVECFRGLARCLACRGANAALGQGEDCNAFSGFAGCDDAP